MARRNRDPCYLAVAPSCVGGVRGRAQLYDTVWMQSCTPADELLKFTGLHEDETDRVDALNLHETVFSEHDPE